MTSTDRRDGVADDPATRRRTGDLTSPWGPRHRKVLLAMLTLISAGAFEGMAVTTVMPVVVGAIGGLGLYAMAFAAPVAGGVVGMVASGRLADRSGPGLPTFTGTALFGVGLVVAGTAQTMPVVVAGRLVHGIGAGMFTVALHVVVARVFPEATRAKVFSAFAAAWVLPAVVGPALGGVVATELGWRWVFLAVPLICVAAAVALRPALRGLPVPEPAEAEGSEPRGAVVVAAAAGTGALALHWAGQQVQDGVAPVPVAVAAAGLVLLAVTVPRLLPRGTWRAARGLPSVILIRGLLAAAFFGAEVYLPLLLQTERGLHPARAGLALTLGALSWSLGSWLRGRQVEPDDRRVLSLGAALIVGGIAFAAVAVLPGVPVAVTVVGWAVGALGMGLSYPTSSLLTLRLSPPALQGRNTSALQVNEALSIAAVLALLGPVFVTLLPHGATGAYLMVFALAAVPAAVGVVVGRRVRPA